ncbi:MAG: hypothetical protein JWQ25_59 [Daejeonella sp.]|nr:hypothetical protein [Daejeonella sp.]
MMDFQGDPSLGMIVSFLISILAALRIFYLIIKFTRRNYIKEGISVLQLTFTYVIAGFIAAIASVLAFDLLVIFIALLIG